MNVCVLYCVVMLVAPASVGQQDLYVYNRFVYKCVSVCNKYMHKIHTYSIHTYRHTIKPCYAFIYNLREKSSFQLTSPS